MAISAGSPMYRGYLVDIDCRYDVISDSVDDRTAEERGLKVSYIINKHNFVVYVLSKFLCFFLYYLYSVEHITYQAGFL